MKRRDFMGLTMALGAGSIFPSLSMAAERKGDDDGKLSGGFVAPGFQADTDKVKAWKENISGYIIPKVSDQMIQVVEFFSYSCPLCQQMSVYNRHAFWSNDLRFQYIRVPVIHRKGDEFYRRLYAWLVAINAPNQLHWLIFDAVKKGYLKPDVDIATLDKWLSKRRFIQSGSLEKTFHHIRVNGIVNVFKRAQSDMPDFGTPLYIVDNEFETSPDKAGGFKDCAIVLDYLADRALTMRGVSLDFDYVPED